MQEPQLASFGLHDFVVLYVDDEPANLAAFRAEFRRDGNILTANSVDESMDILQRESVDLLITDHRMPEATGLELLSRMADDFPDVDRVMVSAYADLDLVKTALNVGRVRWFLEKPWNPEEIRQIIRQTFREGIDRDMRRMQILELARRESVGR